MGKTQITAPENLPFIEISREFDAPRELVFRAYSEPELLKQWLGPRNYGMTVETYEVRDGGRWHYTNTDENGNAYVFHGVFHGPQTPDRMTQTFEFEGAPGHVSLNTLTLEAAGGRTVVLTQSVFQSLEARNAMVESGMSEGVNDGFDRLDELLAGLPTREPAAAAR